MPETPELGNLELVQKGLCLLKDFVEIYWIIS